MVMKPKLRHKDLVEFLKYDPITGVWTWLKRPPGRSRIKVGDEAGTRSKSSYRQIGIFGERFYSASLAYFYMTGRWSKDTIDHKNTNIRDDRWENLRPATKSQQLRNTKTRINKKVPFKGVICVRGRYIAKIRINGKAKYLKSCKTAEEAHQVYREAATKLFGEFARF